jgi:hypothetical protein
MDWDLEQSMRKAGANDAIAKAPASRKELWGIATTIASKFNELQRRVAEIEEKGVVYRGVYQHSDEYRRGDLVTYQGSIFHCVKDVSGEYPYRENNGVSRQSDAWVLAVKRGRDGKDAK